MTGWPFGSLIMQVNMGTGKSIEHRGHVVGFREEIAQAAREGTDQFFGWFDNADGEKSSFIRGSWDFAYHIASPVAPHLARPENKTALEIGHGGGRILAAACRHFKHVIGVDVHECNDQVGAVLQEQGIRNAQLLVSDGTTIPVPSASVDCVYSFIVLQHVERFAVFQAYLREACRVMKPGAVAVLYFGRSYHWSFDRSSRWLYLLDRFTEPFRLTGGFEEVPAAVNCTNLRVSLTCAARVAKATGFIVLRALVSRRRVPDGVMRYGGQNGLVLRKPSALHL